MDINLLIKCGLDLIISLSKNRITPGLIISQFIQSLQDWSFLYLFTFPHLNWSFLHSSIPFGLFLITLNQFDHFSIPPFQHDHFLIHLSFSVLAFKFINSSKFISLPSVPIPSYLSWHKNTNKSTFTLQHTIYW